MPATVMVVDFSKDDGLPDPIKLDGTKEPIRRGVKGGVPGRPINSDKAKQIRQRARRKLKKLSQEEQESLWGKDISEWDMEELAKGRPRAKDGTFKGSPPSFISRQLHEEITKRFETIVREEMNGHTVHALTVLGQVLQDDRVDAKGKPITPAGTKVDVAKFLIEHIVGKPKVRMETDISVKLQGILGVAIANPTQEGYELTSGYVEATSWEDDEDEPE